MENSKEDNIEHLRQKIEDEFNELVKKGEDISCYLYIPYQLLSTTVREKLDIFLLEEAYKGIEKGEISKESFIAYSDSFVIINLDSEEKQIETLNKLIDFFSSKEEYEKCLRIKDILKTYDTNG